MGARAASAAVGPIVEAHSRPAVDPATIVAGSEVVAFDRRQPIATIPKRMGVETGSRLTL